MKIKVFINAFPSVVIGGVDVSTFRFYGPTDNYPYPESKKYDHSVIGFVADNAHEVVKVIHETFKLNPEYSKPEDYIWVKDKFDDYEKDKRPRIGIKLPNGAQGMMNPPSFSIEAD
jgi:hypothetical protein